MKLRGTTQECLAELRKKLGPRADGLVEQFCRVNRRTAQDWLRGQRLPEGERLVRLWTLLSTCGFEVIEVEDLDPTVASLVFLIGFNIVEAGTVKKTLGYEGGQNQHLWRTLRGSSRMLSVKLKAAERLVAEHQEVLEDTQARFPKLTTRPRQPTAPRNTHSNGRLDLVEPLADLLKAALPLAREVESDRFSDKDRDRLRRVVGFEEFFALTNLLHRLGGPQARRVYSERRP